MRITTSQREQVRRLVPWWAKCLLKLALAKAPVGYSVLRMTGLARHGGMESPDYAFEQFSKLFDGVDFARKANGFSALELGPGDSVSMALVLRARGAARTCHLDVGPFANHDVEIYRNIGRFLESRGLTPPDLSAARTFDDVLAACNARYETNGLQSLRAIPSASIDYLFSSGVLQSVQRNELEETLCECRRISREDGVGVHSVDLRDTMGQSLHHLRFSERVWESDWFRRAGFYTNRLRASELADLCRRCGFAVSLPEVNRWDKLPIPRKRLAPPYHDLGEDELRTATLRMVLRPVPSPVSTLVG